MIGEVVDIMPVPGEMEVEEGEDGEGGRETRPRCPEVQISGTGLCLVPAKGQPCAPWFKVNLQILGTQPWTSLIWEIKNVQNQTHLRMRFSIAKKACTPSDSLFDIKKCPTVKNVSQ